MKLVNGIVSLLLLVGSVRCNDLIPQKNVPAILFSHRVSPGLLKYQKNYISTAVMPSDSFNIIAKEFIDHCISDAYIFVNHPGLRKQDFIDFKQETSFLQKFISTASTRLKFEQVKNLPDNTFQSLIEYTKAHCDFTGHIKLNGNNSDDFQPYIDAGKRIIEISYTPLPEQFEERRKSILAFDKYLRTVLAQLPSPDQSIIYSSLSPGRTFADKLSDHIEIFPELFKHLDDQEKNDNLLDIARLAITKFNPKYSGMENGDISVFDEEFLQGNHALIQIIVTTFVGFIVFTIAHTFMKEPTEKQVTKEKTKVLKVKLKENLPQDNHREKDPKKVEIKYSYQK